MSAFHPSLHRREFLAATTATAAASVLAPARLQAAFATAAPETVAFFLVGDTHFLAEKEEPARFSERSAGVTSRLVDHLNKLPGSEIPQASGGGRVLAPRGVIHAGDCIDSGDKPLVKMQETEWAAFRDTYGLTGQDGRLKVPVYEVHGNHDSPRGDGLAVKQIMARNKTRPGVSHVSENGLHYAWDWGGVRFINVGITVGQAAEVARPRRYAPLDSLAFLVSDLQKNVGDSGRPVVITHHVDMLRYAHALPVEDQQARSMEWDPADVQGFYAAIKPYNIAAILYGHTHARNVFRWNGTNKAAESGIPTFNVDNSSHYAGQQQACFYFEIQAEQLLVREYQTTDAWQTAAWNAQTWTAPVVRKPA